MNKIQTSFLAAAVSMSVFGSAGVMIGHSAGFDQGYLEGSTDFGWLQPVSTKEFCETIIGITDDKFGAKK